MNKDLTTASYDEWVQFVFDHPVVDPLIETAWHWKIEYEIDPLKALTFCTRLFNESGSLLKSFDEAKLEQGFWFIPGPNGFMRFLFDASLPIGLRVECVNSIKNLYMKLFSFTSLGSACFMWWDSFITYGAYDNKTISNDGAIATATVQVLGQILKMPSKHCQDSALHGIQHLMKVSDSTHQIVLAHLGNVKGIE